MKLAFVVATKDRAEDLRKLLASLAVQTPKPDEVVVVDASRCSVEKVTLGFKALPIKFIRHLPPCASRQRNVGVAAVSPDIELIGFLDDDTVLEAGAIEAMTRFWSHAAADVAGASFNYKNPGSTAGGWLKRSKIVERLGMYDSRIGSVAPSGWQTIIPTVERTTYVDWLCSGAAVWRRSVFQNFKFDEHFDGYSYLEDVDFSYSVSRHYKLAIVGGPGFLHFPSPRGRISGFCFGKVESRNRLYFVRKHRLSLSRCYLGIVTRLLISLATTIKTRDLYFCQRACGNVAGLLPIELPPWRRV